MKKQLHILFLFVTLLSFGQAVLVKDINKGNLSSSPSEKIVFNNEVYFSANDGINGAELWKTDGTEAGTVLVKDIYTGIESGISLFKPLITNSLLYFFAIENGSQFLWKTDGTEVGTEKVKEFSSVGVMYDEINGKIIFSAENSLWASDGTEAGTIKIANYTIFGNDRFVKNGNEIYFSAEASSAIGKELYKTDGTVAGTKLVKNIRSGSSDSFPNQFVSLNGVVYFSANNGASGTELWTTDGTEAGTKMVQDINPGSGNTFVYNSVLKNFNNELFFIYDNGLWKSDGTATGAVEVKSDLGIIKTLLIVNNKILVIAYNSSTKKQVIWVSDGTDTTYFHPNYTEFSHNNQYAITGNNLYFQGTTTLEGFELWKTDGTEAGTFLVKDVHPQADDNNLENFVSFNGKVLFTGSDGNWLGRELWISDGTEVGTKMVKDINKEGNNSSSPFNYFQFGDKILFSADNGELGRELWMIENNTATLLKDINVGAGYSNPSAFIELNGVVYFKATNAEFGTELWKTDGTETGTKLVKDINPDTQNSFTYGGNIVVANDKLYFFASNEATGIELWESDGTEVGTVLVKDINAGVSNSNNTGEIIAYKSKVYFTAHAGDNDFEVWESDGTEAGTKVHHNYNFSGSINPKLYTLFNDELYYSSNGDLIKTDGTTASLISQTEPSSIVASGDKIFFSASYSDGGELWVSTGTNASLVKDINPGSGGRKGSFPSFLTDVNGTLYFRANDGTNGYELWKSDGTTDGTKMVKDIVSGSGSLNITGIGSFRGKAFFGAPQDPVNNTFSDYELWYSDGTTDGTKIFQDINTSAEQYSSGSNPSNYFVSGSTLYFTATNGSQGHELWKLEDNSLYTENTILEEISQISIYPNPTKNILHLKIDNQKVQEVKIYNLMGKEVLKTQPKNNSVNISELSSGMYLVQLKTDVNSYMKKIIKQ